MAKQSYRNPILPGFHPDPSVCRVGDDYYLVTSTFEFFPGVPIYHSRNLVNWEPVGHCLTRESQLPLKSCRVSGGIYAPTIRYHDGMFYMTTTNVTDRGNFIVHTDDIRGEWSDPAWVAQKGIDPSLLFDGDKVYFCSNAGRNREKGIFLCEIDPLTGECLTESRLISSGCGGRSAEAPHLYRWNGWYYLMLAEGGTEYGHMVTIQRSKSPYGPYEPCPHNPILSHRDLTHTDIECVGHADLFEDSRGNWWMVSLAVRLPNPGGRRIMLHNLGRETFLTPVKWEDGWPVVGNRGLTAHEFEAELPGEAQERDDSFAADFRQARLSPEFNSVREPIGDRCRVLPELSCLELTGDGVSLSEEGGSPAFLGVRQKQFRMEMTVQAELTEAQDGGEAGLSVFYDNEHHYDLSVRRAGERWSVCLNRRLYDLEAVTDTAPLDSGCVFLKVTADEENYRFFYSGDGKDYRLLGSGVIAGLCTEITRLMTFTGVYAGMYAEKARARFRDLSVRYPD